MTFDILLDEITFDVVNIAGDFRTGNADNINQYAIVVSAPGHFKEFPQVGVGIYSFLNGTAAQSYIERAIRVQMEADIYPNSLVDASGFPNIIVNAINVSLR